MELLGDVGRLEPHFSSFGYGVSAVQDRCTVCSQLTTGSEIIVVHEVGHMESNFGPFGDDVSVGA
jgi:nucleoside-triphosphatase THEP1